MAGPRPIGLERVALAVALLAQAAGAGLALFVMLVFGQPSGLTLTCFLVALPACPATAIAVTSGGGSEPGRTTSRRVAWAMVAVEAAFIAAIIWAYSATLSDPRSFAPIGSAIAWPLALSGGCALIAFGLLRAIREAALEDDGAARSRPPGSAVLAVVGIATAALLAGSAAAFAVARTDVGCEVFRFDATAWEGGPRTFSSATHTDTRKLHARALARCGTLEGKTRREVTEMLGGRGFAGAYDLGPTGWIFSYEILAVGYGEDGRVTGARVRTVTD